MAQKQLTQKEKRINRTITLLAWILIISGVTGMVSFYLFSRKNVTTNDAQIEQYITPVSSKVSGFIKTIKFNENQFVRKGDTLIVIDNREFVNQVHMAEANLNTTTENITTIQSSVSTKESDTKIVDAKIASARIDIWRTEQDYKRYKNLLTEDAATEQEFENVKASYEQSKANLLALEQQKNAVRAGANEQQTKVAPAKSQIQQSSANLNNAKLFLSYTVITAPYDGWVGKKTIQEGQLIKEGQALVQMVSKEKWIIANYKETQLGQIDQNQEVIITADAYPDVEFKGKIVSVSPASGSQFSLVKPDNATGNFVKIEQRFPVKIILDHSKDNEKLLSGMNVLVSAKKI
ncbi:HlyD family secretion protein [Chryseobacterium sp. BIGb0232]|uniref:HlyD family secretion protein n=1 Tax=Chryseobacterium sp. BIGb0232 TaxID=2940598 RepID=UPI000F4A79B4|nr:HlyD family secretion protein [Chryseobacterium sp. BIGb0232]MCS4304687.1 membrane fusion protein (multidrug efflux system) [Chryseobacterium sp. BIGb0232]ROS20655.1 membrane fusion protein (multidrug efflux system) [Chryseobacterium nakagawai]